MTYEAALPDICEPMTIVVSELSVIPSPFEFALYLYDITWEWMPGCGGNNT
jgi:hypothetical protein